MNRTDTLATFLGVLAAGLWLGGLVVLGAIVAPIVFHEVPAPASGDAMTLVFRRFDRVALGCAAVLGVVEAVRARTSGVGRWDIARIVCTVVASGIAMMMALRISPAIAELHASGAVRGVGPLGRALDRAHDWATRLGNIEALCLIAVIFLHVRKAFRRDPKG
jgi:putative copper export protein